MRVDAEKCWWCVSAGRFSRVKSFVLNMTLEPLHLSSIGALLGGVSWKLKSKSGIEGWLMVWPMRRREDTYDKSMDLISQEKPSCGSFCAWADYPILMKYIIHSFRNYILTPEATGQRWINTVHEIIHMVKNKINLKNIKSLMLFMCICNGKSRLGCAFLNLNLPLRDHKRPNFQT